jgi:hypothetical protein
MKTNDLIGVAVLVVLLPAIVGYLLWLLRIRPRKQERARHESAAHVAQALQMTVPEPGLVRGVRDGRTVEIACGVSTPLGSLGRGARPRTTCRVWLDPPFSVPFVVATPRRYAGGVTKNWADDVGIGGPTSEALALAASLAPLVQARANALDGMLAIEIDRATCSVMLDGIVVDASILEQALALATGLANAVRAAVPQ